jgi:hypothetical protein
MIRLSRIVNLTFSLVAAFAAAGCQSHAPLPLPDAAPIIGIALSAAPEALVIRPGSSGRIRFVAQDELGQPVPDYPIDFAILPDSNSNGTVDTSLSGNHGLTDSTGAAVLEIIVGNLASDNQPASFSILATCPGGTTVAQVDIMVTTNAYSVEILPLPADDLLGITSIVTTRLLFFDDATCGELDLTNLNAAPTRPRSPHTVAANASWVFSGIAASGSHAVVGLGLDGNTFVQIGGCLDIPGSSLLESETIRATLYMDRLFPVPVGTYQAKSDFKLQPPPSELATIQSTWQQWVRCPLDPARLWLDCTLDALASNPTSDPLDCVPVPGAEGPLGDLVSQRRGTVVAPTAGTTSSTTDAPCRGQTDNSGGRSLEATVAALFADASAQLQGARLGALPDEIAALLTGIHIDSQMTITAGSDINSYVITHDLRALTFPNALALITFSTPTLGLPVTSVSGILATLKAGQLLVPNHGFTLRLGTTARYAFEGTSVKSRGAQDSQSLVNLVFGLAHVADHGTVLSGCAALDAAVCDQLGQPRNCLSGACQNGLGALASKLAGAFDSLDGKALDFFLSGSTPVVDLGGDGLADALGQGGRAGSVSAGPGLWLATVDASGGGYVVNGSWTASRVTNLP